MGVVFGPEYFHSDAALNKMQVLKKITWWQHIFVYISVKIISIIKWLVKNSLLLWNLKSQMNRLLVCVLDQFSQSNSHTVALILYYNPWTSLPSGLFSSTFQTKILYTFSNPPWTLYVSPTFFMISSYMILRV